MEIEKIKSIIEAILFSAGRIVKINELILVLEKNEEEINTIIKNMQQEYKAENRGIEIIKVEDGYQLATKKELYEYIYPILDKRSKPNLSTAALETLSIIAYNPRVTRAEIEAIRGVSADACVYKLLEYGLVEEAGKTDLPGKPMSYKTTDEFLKMFGYTSLKDLPELPRYKLDSNQQIVIDELVENNDVDDKRNAENIKMSSNRNEEEIKAKSIKNEEYKNTNNEKDEIKEDIIAKNEQDKNNINIQNEDIIKENSVKKESEAHQKPEAPMPEREGEDDLFNNI